MRVWTKAEVAMIIGLRRAGWTWTAIGEQLGEGPDAVRSKHARVTQREKILARQRARYHRNVAVREPEGPTLSAYQAGRSRQHATR